jgi:transposase
MRASQRLQERQLRSKPLMDALNAPVTEVVDQFSSQSRLTEAINYMLNHWDGLTLFLSDGRVDVDSNTVERSDRAHRRCARGTTAPGYYPSGSEQSAR